MRLLILRHTVSISFLFWPQNLLKKQMSTTSHRKKGYSRPKGSSLEALAIVNGILESPASQHPLVERLRNRLSSEGTSGLGYAELQRRLNVMDRDGSQTLSFEDFKTALQSKSGSRVNCAKTGCDIRIFCLLV